MLEFLAYGSDNDLIPKSVRLREEFNDREQHICRFASEFPLDIDGIYSYYKLVIPKLVHFQKPSNQSKYQNLKDALFFYDGKLYKSKVTDQNEYDLGTLLGKSDIIDCMAAYDYVMDNEAPQVFYCPIKTIFSVCKLQKCLVRLQKQLLLSNSRTCSYDRCNTDESLRNRRDFLFSAMYVFDYLIDTNNFTEAQRILDNLSSCSSLCGDELIDLNGGCGCGNSL